ncbi:MAG: APA family basic amino acid/polyamine antiporter [Arenicella sp.]|jgi:APA family basic amino acid/polyamine antiporter
MTKTYSFSVWTLVALVVGNAIGAGIYTTSGFALADLGSREWVLLAWLVAGLIALMGALSYGMLVQGLAESGGEYLYLSRSIHPLAGFIAGWISLLAGFPGAIAFAALAFEAYTFAAFPQLLFLPENLLAISIIIMAGLIHIVRTRSGAQTHEVIVGIMLLLLFAIIIWSAWRFITVSSLPIVDLRPLASFSIFAFANSLVWISLSYSGFNAAAYVAGEVVNCKTSVPRGMVIGTLLTMLLCVAINAIMIYGAPYESLAGQADIAAIAAQAMGGTGARRIVEVVIAISLVTSITAMVLAGPRVYAKMAEDGALPKLFSTKTGLPPRMSIVLQVATAVMLVLIADLRGLLSYLGFTLSLCLALAVSSLFVRHWRLQERPSSPWYPWAPIIFVLCTVTFAVLSAINDPTQFYAAIPTVLMGCLAYLVSRKSNSKFVTDKSRAML